MTIVVHQLGFQDQMEADETASRWLGEFLPRLRPPGGTVERYGLRIPDKDLSAQPSGGVINIWGRWGDWRDSGLAAQITIVRTEFNNSLLTIVDFTGVAS